MQTDVSFLVSHFSPSSCSSALVISRGEEMGAGLGGRPGLAVGSWGPGRGTQTLSPPSHFLLPSNFSNYKARFSMPGNNEGLWYR